MINETTYLTHFLIKLKNRTFSLIYYYGLIEYTKYRCGLREDGSYYISDGYKHPNGYKRRYFSEDGLSEN